MGVWEERSPRQSESDRLVEKFTRRRPKPHVVVCSCGWGDVATTRREARDKFLVHALLAD